jgi:arylsulfatase A-like enzyme
MGKWLGAEQKGRQGYEGHLNERVVTIGALLRDASYHTYLAGDWQLFNLREDPGELQDLSKKYSTKREMLIRLWEQYVKTNGVIASDAGPFTTANP